MSKNREVIYLNELIMKIRGNKEIGEIMGNTMIEIAKSCKIVQKEEMPHFTQIRREEVMPKLAEAKEIYCVTLHDKAWGTRVHGLQLKPWDTRVHRLQLKEVSDMINRVEDAVFYERIEESEEPE